MRKVPERPQGLASPRTGTQPCPTAGPGALKTHGPTSNPQHAQALPAWANRHVERQTAFSTRTGSRRGLAIARQALTFA